jgi:hypothetical protein
MNYSRRLDSPQVLVEVMKRAGCTPFRVLGDAAVSVWREVEKLAGGNRAGNQVTSSNRHINMSCEHFVICSSTSLRLVPLHVHLAVAVTGGYLVTRCSRNGEGLCPVGRVRCRSLERERSHEADVRKRADRRRAAGDYGPQARPRWCWTGGTPRPGSTPPRRPPRTWRNPRDLPVHAALPGPAAYVPPVARTARPAPA